MAFLCFCWLED